MRFNLVRCKNCGKIVGADYEIKKVERCNKCHRGEKKSKSNIASPFAKVKKGPAPDLPKKYRDKGYSYRSSWERNFARWLCIKGASWTFEELEFPTKINPDTGKWYPKKPWGYLPDFYEVKADIIWEVKGFFRSRDRSKVRRFKKHYPDEFNKLKVCLSKSNKTAQKFYSKMGVPFIFYEDIKKEYLKLCEKKNKKSYWE